jgi:NAD(P)-dependent dehydrogenase (short-subunit alcohol dehydrogenase family)
VLTARVGQDAEREARKLAATGLDVISAELDVALEHGAEELAKSLAKSSVHVDVLVNNAGVYPQRGVLDAPIESFREALDVNFSGALRTIRAFAPGMVRAGYGRIVNVSSGSGSFGECLEGPAPYCVSKVAMNALTVKLAQELRGDVKVNAVCPGWVRTRMGGRGADLAVEDSVDTIVWLASLPASGPSGGFFRDRAAIPW